ncbi:hypothetical protein G3O06_04805 [Burkholderia sp. Ac-20345]|uniref:hypothetical protein n=1 Tax=Burkholderia sp. Ac-20345 TaxID=2703891 RepID=UPI00197C9B2F|nr:hypothetical protein [Burkholderia sp. Ac-20345]MBN3776890.1 hypothetical protein [Burkholderia sp. Ac-20345]
MNQQSGKSVVAQFHEAAVRVAIAFCRQLALSLTEAELTLVRERNRVEESAGVCHTHDFCDANMLMLDAFVECGLAENQEACSGDELHPLGNSAWKLAAEADFRVDAFRGPRGFQAEADSAAVKAPLNPIATSILAAVQRMQASNVVIEVNETAPSVKIDARAVPHVRQGGIFTVEGERADGLISEARAYVSLAETVTFDEAIAFIVEGYLDDFIELPDTVRHAINSATVQRSLVVDGTDPCGNFAGDGKNAPFVVFDVDRQENIAGPFDTRDAGEKARLAILEGTAPMLDVGALQAYLERDEKPRANGSREIRLAAYDIVITLLPQGGGVIESSLHDDDDSSEAKAALDGLESMMLAHAVAGIDIRLPAYLEGIETAVEAIWNRYDVPDQKQPGVTVRDAAKALLDAFGGDTPSWLREEAVALENALAREAGANEGKLPAAREGRKPEIASTKVNWKEVAGSLYGAVDSLEIQVNQMKGLFPDEDGLIQEALEEAGEATRSYLVASRASRNSAIGLLEKPVTSRMLAEQYPVKGSMPHAVVHQLYQLREAEISTLSQQAVILESDLRELDRGGRAVVASMLYAKCDDVARNTLLHDEHPHVRSCAVISSSELESEPGHKPSTPSIDV